MIYKLYCIIIWVKLSILYFKMIDFSLPYVSMKYASIVNAQCARYK